MNSAYLTVNGLRTHVLAAGNTGSPVLLLHGGGVDSARLSWSELIGPLSKTHRVFAPDWPSYGESDRPDVRYTIDYYIRFLHALLEALGLSRASLAGISMGGGIALGFSLERPAQVDRLVLIDSYGLSRKAPAHLLSALLVKLPFINELIWARLPSSRSLVKASLRNIFADPDRISKELVEDVFAEVRRPHAGRAFTTFQRNEVSWSGLRTVFMDRLEQINIPTLILHGEKDTLVPVADAIQASRRLPDAALKILPGCGHWPQRECPEMVNAKVIQHLASVAEINYEQN